MNKAQLIDKLAERTGTTKQTIETLLTQMTVEIREAVCKGDDVKLVGLGTFTKSKRKARTGRNPQNGKVIKIPAGWYPKFRAGAEFKELIK